MISPNLYSSLDKKFKDFYRINQLWFKVRHVICEEWDEKKAQKLFNYLLKGDIVEAKWMMIELEDTLTEKEEKR